VLSFNAAPDFENPTDFNTDGVYEVQVTVDDGLGGTDVQLISVTVTNVNEYAPRIDDASAPVLNENSANGIAVIDVNEFFTGNDTDRDGQALVYSITGGNTDGAFAINPATGVISVANAAALDFEATPIFNVTVQATDGTLADTATITVKLADVNEPPTNTVPGPQSVNQDTPLAFSGANAITAVDPEGGLTDVQLTVLNGTLSVTLRGGATISAGAIGTGTLTISGGQADINATLATLVYQGNPNFSGVDSLTVMSMSSPAPGNDTDSVAITVSSTASAPLASSSGPIGLNTPDLGWPSGASPFPVWNLEAGSGQSAEELELRARNFVLPAVDESLRLRNLQAARLAGSLTAADVGEIEAVSLGDGLQVEPTLFVLPTVEQIRNEFNLAGERAREFATKPAAGTAPLLNDFDAYTRFLGPDGTERKAPAAAESAAPESAGAAKAVPDSAKPAADSTKPAPDAAESALGAAAGPKDRSAPPESQPAGAPAFSAQLQAAAALRTQLDAQLLASLRAPRKN